MRRLRSRWLLAAAIVSCDVADRTAAPGDQPPAVPPPSAAPPAVATLILEIDTRVLFTGAHITAQVIAFDPSGARIATDEAVVRSVNPEVAKLGAPQFYDSRINGNPPIRQLHQDIALVGVGTAVVVASLRGVHDSVVFTVDSLPPPGTSLVVEAFTIIEYRVQCSFECPYLAYSPQLRLRDVSDNAWTEVIAVEFSLGALTTGWCRAGGPIRLGNGYSADIVGIDPYLHNNDMLFISLNGTQLPGPARARVILKDVAGQYERLEVIAPVLRGVVNPTFHQAPWDQSWTCGITPIP